MKYNLSIVQPFVIGSNKERDKSKSSQQNEEKPFF